MTNLEVPGPPHQEEASTTLPQQQEVSTTPQQQQQQQQEKTITIEPEGVCSFCYCDLPLITSWGRFRMLQVLYPVKRR